MKRLSQPRRRGETFEQWKSRKERQGELSMGRPRLSTMSSYLPNKLRSFDYGDNEQRPADSLKPKQRDEDVIARDRLKAIILKEEHEIRKRFRSDSDAERLARNEDIMKLTFHEWLYKKELEAKDKKKREESQKLELLEKQKLKKEKSKKAVDEWMMRTKYRAYAKYFPNIGSENVNKALLEYMENSQ